MDNGITADSRVRYNPVGHEQTTTDVLLIADGLNVVRRVYEANPAPDSRTKAEGAVRSSLGSFRRALTEHRPTHFLAAFDHGGPTWRHELYSQYKVLRKPMPAELQAELPTLYAQLAAMGLTTCCVPGVEADDVITAVARRWRVAKRGRVIVLSTDKDLAQLLEDEVEVRDHFKPEWRDDSWVQAKFGVPVPLLGDLLALMGDSADGIPGVPGVGIKTAAKLLLEHGNLITLLDRAGEVKGKVGESLRAAIAEVRLARRLVDFKTDMVIGLTWRAMLAPDIPTIPKASPEI